MHVMLLYSYFSFHATRATFDQAALDGSSSSESVDDPDQQGSDLMSELMMEVLPGVGCYHCIMLQQKNAPCWTATAAEACERFCTPASGRLLFNVLRTGTNRGWHSEIDFKKTMKSHLCMQPQRYLLPCSCKHAHARIGCKAIVVNARMHDLLHCILLAVYCCTWS